jgi:hypothetical protein
MWRHYHRLLALVAASVVTAVGLGEARVSAACRIGGLNRATIMTIVWPPRMWWHALPTQDREI